jgi:hypothetical protein
VFVQFITVRLRPLAKISTVMVFPEPAGPVRTSRRFAYGMIRVKG